MLYSADSGVRRKTPAFGRLTPALRRRQIEGADVEVAFAALERLLGEQRVEEPRRRPCGTSAARPPCSPR